MTRLPAAAWQDSPGMTSLLGALGGQQGDARYVGGCVRDTLLGLDVSDIDIATRLRPEEVVARLEAAGIRAIPTGFAHGTVTAIARGTRVEVTTLRRDIATDGRRATVAFTDDWREDAARRDFTINALSADPSSAALFDYFGGQEDLAGRRVRFIGEPFERIAEDHLRILRFFRFHARFGNEAAADAAGLAACAARANDLMALSRERIADELFKLLALPAPVPAVRLLVGHGILRPVLPEIAEDAPVRLGQLVACEAEAGVAGDPLRRLAALLPPDPPTAAAVAARLRLSTRSGKRLAAAAAWLSSARAAPEPLAYEIGGVEAVDRLLLAGDPAGAQRLRSWTRPRFALGGGDLIAMGLAPGPGVARTLRAIESEWAASGFYADADAQRALARRHVDQALRDSQ